MASGCAPMAAIALIASRRLSGLPSLTPFLSRSHAVFTRVWLDWCSGTFAVSPARKRDDAVSHARPRQTPPARVFRDFFGGVIRPTKEEHVRVHSFSRHGRDRVDTPRI